MPVNREQVEYGEVFASNDMERVNRDMKGETNFP
jgi:hypothetical protein